MSGIAEPLLGQSQVPKGLDASGILEIAQKPPTAGTTPKVVGPVAELSTKVKAQNALRRGLKEIKSEILERFSLKQIKLPFDCEIIIISTKHSLLVGSSNDNYQIALLDLVNSTTRIVPTELESLSCIRLNSKESEIYLGTDDGLLVKYEFPSFSPESKETFTIGKGPVVFDHFSNEEISVIYAADMQDICLIRIDLITKEQKTIARFRYPTYVRVSPGENHVAVASDTSVVVYSRQYKWKELAIKITQIEQENEWDYNEIHTEIGFTHDGSKLGVSYYNYIQIWDLEKKSIERTLKLNTEVDITSFKFTKDDDFIAAVGVDHSINIWKTSSTSNLPKFINKPIEEFDKDKGFTFEDAFYELEIDEDKNMIYTHQQYSNNSYQWRAIFLDKIKYPNSEFDKDGQRILVCKRRDQVIVSNIGSNEFYVWGIKTLDMQYSLSLPTTPWEFTLDAEEKFLYIGSDSVIYKVDVDTYQHVEEIRNEVTGSIYALRVNTNFIFSGGETKIILVQTLSGIRETEIKSHNGCISAMKVYNEYLITGDFEGVIMIHMIGSWNEYAKLHMHSGWLRTIEVFKNGDTLITVARDKKCIFWSIYDKIHIKVKELSGPVDSCYLSNDERSFIISTTEGEMHVYNLPSFESIIVKNFKDVGSQRFAVDKDEEFILVSNSEGVYRTLSPISKSNPEIIDEQINIPAIKRFLKGDRSNQNGVNDKWILAPFMVNSLHYYSYENLKQNLKAAMVQNSKYLKSSLGTPLDISLLKGNTEATGTIISQLKQRVKENNFALETISDCLVELNLGGFKGLDELYTDCLIVSPEKELPDTCNDGVSLPVVNYALTMKIHPESFIGERDEDSTMRIQFLISTIRMNLVPGSSESIEFLESLMKCSNTDIFKTKFIQTILYDKWSKVRWIMITNAIMYICYLLFLSCYIITRNSDNLIICFTASTLLAFYELMQMFLDPYEYIKDSWNIIDLTRATLFYVYFYYSFILDEPVSWVLISVTILSWIRGITLFALSTNTRYMISLLGEVLKDIISFAIIVFYSIIAFAFIKLSVGSGLTGDTWEQLGSIRDLVIYSYFEAIGNFETDLTGFEQYLVIINSIFNVIIMMNLLISILGSTYGRVNDESLVEDLKQLTEMIIEAESLMFTKRGVKTRSIMQICEEYTPVEIVGADDIKMRFRTVRTDINSMKSKNDDFYKKSLQHFETLLADRTELNAKIDSTKKDTIDELKSTIEDLRKQVIAVAQANEETESGEASLFKCLSGHDLRPKLMNQRICDICRIEIDNAQALCCKICGFDMCMKCAQLYYDHNPGHIHIKCNLEHTLLHFTNIEEFFNEKNYDEQVCRFCNDAIQGEAYHCVPCMFSVCLKCKNISDAAFQIKEKTMCKKSHNLKWRHKEFYNKESFLLKCSTCDGDEKDRLGSGFFSCVECPSYWCLKCFNKKVINKESDEEHKSEGGIGDEVEDKENEPADSENPPPEENED